MNWTCLVNQSLLITLITSNILNMILFMLVLLIMIYKPQLKQITFDCKHIYRTWLVFIKS